MINDDCNEFIDLDIKKFNKDNISYRVITVDMKHIKEKIYISQLYYVLKTFFEATLLNFNWQNIEDFECYINKLTIDMKHIYFIVETRDHLFSKFFCVEDFSF